MFFISGKGLCVTDAKIYNLDISEFGCVKTISYPLKKLISQQQRRNAANLQIFPGAASCLYILSTGFFRLRG